jgi:DNA repair protein RadC
MENEKHLREQMPELKVTATLHKPLGYCPMKITSSRDAYDILKFLFDPDTFLFQEEVLMLMLNRSNRVVGFYHASKGGINGTTVDIRNILGALLSVRACGFVMAHNHPSGNVNPSESDIRVTRQLADAGKLMEIQLIDHLILTEDSYTSLADSGLLR